MGKYFSWNVCEGIAQAGNITLPVVRSSKGVLYEGVRGIMTEKHTTAISGTCLFDAQWCVKFKTGAIRSVASSLDRMRVEDRIRRGFEAEFIIFPTELSAYHTKLINFVADTIMQNDSRELLFHIPTEEYKQYISALEKLLQKKISGAYNILDAFAEKVRQYFVEKMCDIGFKNYHVIEPMKGCVTDPEESYRLPYAHPEIFGAQKECLYAIEDLVEIKIALEVEKACGHQIPVTYCVIDIPHPYATFDKEAALSGEGMSIVLI